MKCIPVPYRLVLPLLASLLLSACNTNPFKEVPDKLTAKVRTFEDVVRWGALQKMYLFQKIDPDKPPKIPEGLDNIRVTDYQAASPLAKSGEYRWTQTVVIDYVLIDRQVVRQVVDPQVWVSEDEGKSWYRQTPVPQFR